MNIRAIAPAPLKLAYRLLQRSWADYRSGISSQMARYQQPDPGLLIPGIRVEQPIMPSAFFENKVHNMHTAALRIQPLLLLPGQVFSFWNVVGYPGPRQGFKKGRNLVAGKIRGDYGGGLCQVSGLLYYVALATGMEILERHAHSVDIYTEDARFAPLGADATVVYGYKDLRFRNTSTQPLRFQIAVSQQSITAELLSSSTLDYQLPEFVRTDLPDQRIVRTMLRGEVVAESVYGVMG